MANNGPTDNGEYISPGEAAAIAFVTTKTLARFADTGKIKSIRPGSHRRYLRADVEALLAPTAA
jgi:excisionase family DNA binding protein